MIEIGKITALNLTLLCSHIDGYLLCFGLSQASNSSLKLKIGSLNNFTSCISQFRKRLQIIVIQLNHVYESIASCNWIGSQSLFACCKYIVCFIFKSRNSGIEISSFLKPGSLIKRQMNILRLITGRAASSSAVRISEFTIS